MLEYLILSHDRNPPLLQHTKRLTEGPAKYLSRGVESEYGRQLSGGMSNGFSPAVATYSGQFFLGSEIIFLAPRSLSLANHVAHLADSTLGIEEGIDASYTEQSDTIPNPFEVNISLGTSHVISGDRSNLQQMLPVVHKAFLRNYFNENQSFSSSINPELSSHFDDRLMEHDPNSPITQSPSTLIEQSADLPVSAPILRAARAERERVPASDSVVMSPSANKDSLSGYLKSFSLAVVKSSEDKEVEDTLISGALSKLDATYSKNIEFVIYVGSNDATLIGNSENNTLVGNIGNDTLTGGGGDDHLIGGAGDDVFVFGVKDGHNQVIDFSSGDKLHFKGAAFMNQLTISAIDSGQQIRFADTVVDIVGASGLVLDHDWITLSR